MVSRPAFLAAIDTALRRSQVAALLGPRQSGKTTLARVVAERERATYFDLEDPRAVARLETPMLTLEPLRGLVVIDEIQRRPELLPLLRVLADRDPLPARFLVLGSASPTLMRDASESLAGRIEFVDLGGFDVTEVGSEAWERLWLRGGLPRSFLAETDDDSFAWREGFVRTFLERDIPQLGIRIASATLRRFWTMLAHYHGQIWRASEFGRSFGLSDHTVRRYLDLLAGTYVVRQLPPWFENLSKRQVKRPKIFISDSGLLHSLLDLRAADALAGHPKLGASWEGFAMEQVLRIGGARNAYFWATHAGAELDLLMMRNGDRWGFEFKYADAPRVTKSMHVALNDLQLDRLWVVYPGRQAYALHEKVAVVPLVDVAGRLRDEGR